MDLLVLRKKWLAPLIFFEIYLGVSVLLFFLGPWPWLVEKPITLAVYLVASQIFIFFGYFLAWKRVKKTQSHINSSMRNKQVKLGIVFLKRALIITLIMFIPTSLSRTGALFPDIFAGLNNTGDSYNENYERLASGNSFVIVEYLRMIFSVFLVGLYPLAVVYWAKLSWKIRVLCVAAILLNLSIYIAIGVNKGLADFVITLPWLIFFGVSTAMLKFRFNPKLLTVGFVIMFVLFMQFFGKGQLERSGGVGEYGVLNVGEAIIQANRTDDISSVLSFNYQIIYESITRYLGTGYYALSKTFEIKHDSTMGLGASMFLARNANAIFGTTFFTNSSLPGLLETQTGFGMFTLWHSIYPWLASDFGFIGTLFVMGMLAYLFALSWGNALVTLSSRWIILSFLMFILFYYIPANNQIFQSGESCLAFIFLVVGTLLSDFHTRVGRQLIK